MSDQINLKFLMDLIFKKQEKHLFFKNDFSSEFACKEK